MDTSYHTQQSSDTKICKNCHQEKPLDAFYQRSDTTHGRRITCKVCEKEWKASPKIYVQPSLFSLVCTDCGEEKPLENFAPHKKGARGRRRQCDECSNKSRRAHRKEHNEEYRRKEIVREKRLQKGTDDASIRYRENAQKARARWLEKNTEKRKESVLRWRVNNPLKVMEMRLRRVARQKNASVEPVNYDLILERDGLICCICNAPINPSLPGNTLAGLTFDHDIPLSKGGTHSIENVHPAHRLCNCRKHDKTLAELTPHMRRGPFC